MVLSHLLFLLDENVKMFESIISACKIQLNDIFFEREREKRNNMIVKDLVYRAVNNRLTATARSIPSTNSRGITEN